MKKLLVIVDMQKDFIDGSLGSKEAQAIVPKVVDKINNWDGDIIVTKDTHGDNYLNTREGKYLPVSHCIKGTPGHNLNGDIISALAERTLDNKMGASVTLEKETFGSKHLPKMIASINGEPEYDYIELIGLCTDICVVSNALLLKACYPEIDIAVDAKCCAGVTPEKHKAALMTMESCQIDILNNAEV